MVYNDWLKPPFIFYVLIGILGLWLAVLTVGLWRYIRHYNRLTKKTGKQGLKSILEEILRFIQQNQKDVLDLEKKYQKLDKESVRYLQKVGFLRFNPFSDTGGEQSFILTILDGKGDGMVISSLHSRGTTRLYAKEIEKGESRTFGLSKEEEQVINKLLKQSNKKG